MASLVKAGLNSRPLAIHRSQTPMRPRVSGLDVTPLTSSSLCYLKVTALRCFTMKRKPALKGSRGGAAGTSGAAVSPKSRESVPEVPRHPPHVSFLFPPSFSLTSVKPSDRVSLIAVLKRSLCAPSVLCAVAALISNKQKHFENLSEQERSWASLPGFINHFFRDAKQKNSLSSTRGVYILLGSPFSLFFLPPSADPPSLCGGGQSTGRNEGLGHRPEQKERNTVA
ncbi:hypothetical protein Q8A67_025032 [Cirrhinus molitorella]|uniref:Uncharacterized protein n=1 Tax=Cirrhinus molitorella TaxID=172907 RepID=A0AA88NVG5_9TELE|nr:hypothetical protein Q8A67_025032 [Cirrhinus molitorella]